MAVKILGDFGNEIEIADACGDYLFMTIFGIGGEIEINKEQAYEIINELKKQFGSEE